MKKSFPDFGKARLAFLLLFFVGSLSQSAWAAGDTTTLNFSEYPNSTVLTTQYQSEGVTISGATILTSCPTCIPFPSVTGDNIAYAPTGSMTFTFSPTVIGGQVQTVSVYVTDNYGPVGLYAYDSSNNLLGESVMPTWGVNVLLSVTTSGAPIAYVTIHDAGSQFGISGFTFTYTATCSGNAEQLQTEVASLPASDFKDPKAAALTKKLLVSEIQLVEYLVANKKNELLILADLDLLQAEVNELMVAGNDKTAVLAAIQQIVALAKTGGC